MHAWQRGEDCDENKRRMRDTHQRPQPPCRHSKGMEKKHIDEGDPPAIEKMYDETDDLGSVAVGRHHGSKQEGGIHAGQVQRLPGPEECGQEPGSEQSPEQRIADVHDWPFTPVSRRSR